MVNKAPSSTWGGVGPSDQGYFLSLLVPVKLHLKCRSCFGHISSRGMWSERLKQKVRGLRHVTYLERVGELGSCHLVKRTLRRWSNTNLSYLKRSCKEKKNQTFLITSTGNGPRLNLERFSLGIGKAPSARWVLQHWTGFPERLLIFILELSGLIQTKPWLTWSAGGAGPVSSRMLD